MDRHSMYEGQTLILDSKQTGRLLVKVKRVNPKNIKVVTEVGKIWNAPPYMLSTPEAGEVFASTAPSAAAPAVGMTLGSVIKFVDPARPRGLFVVCGHYSGAWRVAKLGGEGGRYFTGITNSEVEIVDFTLAGV